MVRRLRAIVGGIGVALILGGCVGGIGTPRALRLSADELTNPPCGEVVEVAVESLDTEEPPTCDPAGSELRFPDGATLTIQNGAGSTFSSVTERTSAYVHVGDHGVVVSQYTGDCENMVVWGRADAIAKVIDAFGEYLGGC